MPLPRSSYFERRLMGEWTVAVVVGLLREAASTRHAIDTGAADPVGVDGLAALARTADWSALLDDLDAEIVRLRTSGSRWSPR